MRESSKLTKFLIYAIFTILAVIVIMPYLWIVGNSFNINTEIGKYGGIDYRAFIPVHWTLNNYILLIQRTDLARVLFNTIFVAITVTFISLFLNSLAAFALARMEFKGKKIIFSIIIATIVVPFEVLILPLFQTVKQLNLQDSYLALILPFSASAFGIFFLRQFFLEIPISFEEAAYLDGASSITIYGKVMLPLLKAPIVTMGMLIFMQQWDNFLWPVTIINNEKLTLLQVALAYIATKTEHVLDFGVVFSGVVVSAIPIIIVFLFIQRYYIQSVMSAGVKG